MISPTSRAVWLMLMGVPLMLAIALIAPALWIIAGGWVVAVLSLMLLDAVMGASLRDFETKITPPSLLYIDSSDPLRVCNCLAVWQGNVHLADGIRHLARYLLAGAWFRRRTIFAGRQKVKISHLILAKTNRG